MVYPIKLLNLKTTTKEKEVQETIKRTITKRAFRDRINFRRPERKPNGCLTVCRIIVGRVLDEWNKVEEIIHFQSHSLDEQQEVGNYSNSQQQQRENPQTFPNKNAMSRSAGMRRTESVSNGLAKSHPLRMMLLLSFLSIALRIASDGNKINSLIVVFHAFKKIRSQVGRTGSKTKIKERDW